MQAAKEATQAEQGKKLAEAKEVREPLLYLVAVCTFLRVSPACQQHVLVPVQLSLSASAALAGDHRRLAAPDVVNLGKHYAERASLALTQKLDKELEKALAALEAERNDALKNLDSQVSLGCAASVFSARRSCLVGAMHAVGVRLLEAAPTLASSMSFALTARSGPQVEKLSADILARVLPEGIKL